MSVIATDSRSNDNSLSNSILLEFPAPNSQYLILCQKSKSTSMPSYRTSTDLQKDDWIIVKDREELSSLADKKNRPSCIIVDSSFHLTLADMKAVEVWLQNSKVDYVVLDNRIEYNMDLDSLLLRNTLAVYPWYEDILRNKNSSLSKKEIYKLVWLPGKKIDEDLSRGSSSVPTDWLYKMSNYHLCYKIDKNLSTD